MIRLHTHLKRMIIKASVMGHSITRVHKDIDEILYKYGVRDRLEQKDEAKNCKCRRKK